MSSKGTGARRTIYKPSADFARRKIPVTVLDAGVLIRLHASHRPALEFGTRAGNRFTPENPPHGVMYLGEDLGTCIFEIFGDEMLTARTLVRAFKWMNCSVSLIAFPALRVCDFTDSVTTTAAGVDLASLMAHELEGPQAWSRAVMNHPLGFQAIRYASRFTGRHCLALFDLPDVCGSLAATSAGLLHEMSEAGRFLDEYEVTIV
jgi:hypothetical protein